jgi:hypothetical protein
MHRAGVVEQLQKPEDVLASVATTANGTPCTVRAGQEMRWVFGMFLDRGATRSRECQSKVVESHR